ncbi:MAG: 30S ribosomal protein S1 [Bryobacteraceae bacterium]
MSNVPDPEQEVSVSAEAAESFADILSEYEQSHRETKPNQEGTRIGTVIAVTAENVVVDIGYKMEGVIPLAGFQGVPPKSGDTLQVSITGRDAEGYYTLSRIQVARPKDWTSFEKAFNEKATIAGKVTGVVKGGLTVDVGVRAFMPASRSGARDAAELEGLVEKEITCRIIKLDTAEEDVVVDRRAVLEEEERSAKERRYSEVHEGDVLRGKVRTLMEYGAFVDIGGVDGLLHVADMSWARLGKPSDLLSVGQEVEVRVLKVDPGKKRISLGLKQLSADPWTVAQDKYKTGERIHGTVTRVTEFGAFVELEEGVEGLIHLSEMSWTKKIRKPSDVVKPGDSVEVMVLGVNPADKRISLGLKQALGDPWAEVDTRFPVDSIVEGKVTNLAKFGAFVDVGDGIEGMIHIGDLSSERRINHPSEVVKAGDSVRAIVLGVDRERRRLRLGVKQLQPTTTDEYIAEHHEGDVVTGRVAEVRGVRSLTVELADGVRGQCAVKESGTLPVAADSGGRTAADLSSLTSMLAAKWKAGGSSAPTRAEGVREGEVRSFRIVRLDKAKKQIDVEMV